MLKALYFPHVNLSPALIKNALFLWDKVDFISPYHGFSPSYHDTELREAEKFLLTPKVPNDNEKREADEAIVDLLSKPLPNWFFVENLKPDLRYQFYPEKLFPETWERLKGANLAINLGDSYETSAALGLSMMAILAECCAGTEKRLITDEANSYSSLNNYLLTIGGGDLNIYDDQSENLVSITTKIMNFENVSVSRLLEIREKENSSSGASLKVLRHGYLRRIEEFADRILGKKDVNDVEEVKRQFEQEMRVDFDLLKDELKDEAIKVLFSAEMVTAAIGVIGSFFEPNTGLTLAGGALYRVKTEYSSNRNKSLQNHPMSWLYSMKRIHIV